MSNDPLLLRLPAVLDATDLSISEVGAPSTAAGADFAADLKGLLALFTGDVDTAYFVVHPRP